MTIFRLKHIQLLFLITAFLAIQWTTTHTHFEEQHNHDGSLHQHQIKTHAHQFIVVNDASVQDNHTNIITVSVDYNLKNTKKQNDSSSDAVPQIYNPESIISLSKIKIPVFIESKQGYSLYSSYNSRAPPLNS
jgi:flagellar basal body-associated protein FliL